VERATRERLTGAVIFVAALAIAVPELLTGPDEGKAREAGVPADAGPPLATYELPINPGSASAGVHRQQPAAVPDPEAIAQAVPPPVTEQARTAGVPPAAEVAPAPATPKTAPAEASRPPDPAPGPVAGVAPADGWWVQLGSFSSEQNAQRLARDLRSRGFAIEVATVKSGGKDLHRVRAGPEKSREAAEALKARLGPAARDSKLVAP
jgi:DedD protein